MAAAIRGPRIGRLDVSTALRRGDGVVRARSFTPPRRPPPPLAIPAALAGPTPPKVSTRAHYEALVAAAADLAGQLKPLDEIAKRVQRHRASSRGVGKDAALAAELDRLQERLFILSLAVWRLARVAR